MFTKSTIIHLRLPFSLFLSPVFLFALSHNVLEINVFNSVVAFIVLHFFIYPASNGYNSYFDRDEGSIGGIKNPPPVTPDLYWASLLFDGLGLLLSLLISPFFAIMVLIYLLISKAYSHPRVRLKRYPFLGWLTVGLFQGAFIYLTACSAFYEKGFGLWLRPSIYLPALLSTLLLLASYPMTQIYQHREDKKKGDVTISAVVGVKGTFYLTAGLLIITYFGFGYFYQRYYSGEYFFIFLAFLAPVFIYLWLWLSKVIKEPSKANFNYTMGFNAVFSFSMIAYFSFFAMTQVLK